MSNAFKLLKSQSNKPQLIPSYKKTERSLLSTFMSAMEISPVLRGEVFKLVGYNSGRTCRYQSVMEPQYSHPELTHARPDGLIQCQRGQSVWSAFIEAKADDKEVGIEQMSAYANLANKLGVDSVISISNAFSASPKDLPYHFPKGKRRGRDIYHLAWPELRTLLSNLISDNRFNNEIEALLASEVLRYMHAPDSGVVTFDAMSSQWKKIVDAAGIGINLKNIAGFAEIISDWQQERRDLLDKLTGISSQKIRLVHEAGVRATQIQRDKSDRETLALNNEMRAIFQFMDSSSVVMIAADLSACTVKAQLAFPAAPNKQAKATASWLADCLSDLEGEDFYLTIDWPGHTPDTVQKLDEFLSFPDQLAEGARGRPKSIALSKSVHDKRKFGSAKGFITLVESTVLDFYSKALDRGLL